MPKPTHIGETALYVADLARAIQFYTALFGCPILRRDDRFCALRITDEQVLLLFLRGGSVQPIQINGGVIPAHDGNGPLHVCFGIQFDELTQWQHRLEKLGIAIESHFRWPAGATSLYFRDPDHHMVELATPGLWKS